ncbi:hypothetical protein KSC_031870 [Ktedonobacter sp. SOSP1-52]|uniref:hypothetical protein n=1 Tax=Ktedonobacter sp. SOSP1-52 TaxID=2778366 RepID=UPI0019163F61|nr:hypothetical protein [Ktedonobacter sp. SOSP1-52]GHO64295.1 hypothetical protein KSC_031870 [Ktedonobacter sp. SOSP1-52]
MTMENTLGIQLPNGHHISLTPEQALDFLQWLHPQMPELPHAIATWLAQHHPLPPDLPPLEPYVVVERAPDGLYYITDFGLDLPDNPL